MPTLPEYINQAKTKERLRQDPNSRAVAVAQHYLGVAETALRLHKLLALRDFNPGTEAYINSLMEIIERDRIKHLGEPFEWNNG